MRSTKSAAALIAVLGMPVIAYVLARVTLALAAGWDPTSLPDADAGVVLQDGLTLAAAAFGAATATYLAVSGYAMILGAAWRGGRTIPKALAAMAPPGWTKLTATALGLSMSTGLAGPALASEGASPVASAGWVPAPVSVAAKAAPLASVGWVPATVTPAGWTQAPVLVSVGDPRPTAGSTEVSTAGSTAGSAAGSTAGWVAATPAAAVSPVSPAAPDSAPTTSPTQASTTQASAAHTSAAYVVQPGDSLWRIAESLLGEGTSTVEVAEAWPSLYEANRAAIGDNPSLIHPGLALTIPAGFGA